MKKLTLILAALAFLSAGCNTVRGIGQDIERVARPSRRRPNNAGIHQTRRPGGPLDRNNVDTDAIIPKQFLKSIKRSGFGPNAFDEWRYMDHGEPGMDNSKRP